MAELVLCCGKVCSGKSTFSSQLENEFAFFSFSLDSWVLHFYGETEDLELFDTRLNKCEEKILEICEKLLGRGINISLDFGFWTISKRDAIRNRFEGLGHTVSLVYFPISFELQIKYMKKRQENSKTVHYVFDEETIKTLNPFFEEPIDRETIITKDEYLSYRRDALCQDSCHTTEKGMEATRYNDRGKLYEKE